MEGRIPFKISINSIILMAMLIIIFSRSAMASVIPVDERSQATCLDSTIKNVTVYPQQAEVTRTFKLSTDGKGTNWFCLRSLPINLSPNSLKIKFPSTPGQKDHIVLEKVYRLVQLKQVIQEKIAELETLLAKRLGADQKIQLDRQLMQFLTNLRFRPQLGNQSEQPLTFQASDRRILSSLESISGQISDLRKSIQKQEDEIFELEDSIQQLQTDLRQQNNVQTQSWSYDLYFTVDTKKGNYEAEVKYLVPNVTWNPLYDVRADIDPRNSKINIRLITLAELKQNTLEDWVNVETEFASLEPLPLYMPTRNRWVFEEVREEVVKQDEGRGGFFDSIGSSMDMAKEELSMVQAERQALAPPAEKKRSRRRSKAKKMVSRAAAKPSPGASYGKGMQGIQRAESLADDFAPAMEVDGMDANSLSSFAPFQANFSVQPTNRNLFALGSVKELYASYGQMVNNFDQMSRQYESQRNIVSRYDTNPQIKQQNSELARKANGRNITYKAKIPISLERTDSPLRVPLDSSPLKAELTYLSIPHKDPNVYIRAKVFNSTSKPILGGKAQIFINGKLTTKTDLSSISEKGIFWVDLGMDKNVEVERVVDRSSEDEGVLFKKHKTKVDIKIKIANRHNFPVNLSIGDRQPLSPHKDIEINSLKISDGGALVEPTGQITWNLNLKPKEKKELIFSYRVTHPENFLISELN